MKSDIHRLMARELAETVKKMPKLDWARREFRVSGFRRGVGSFEGAVIPSLGLRGRHTECACYFGGYFDGHLPDIYESRPSTCPWIRSKK